MLCLWMAKTTKGGGRLLIARAQGQKRNRIDLQNGDVHRVSLLSSTKTFYRQWIVDYSRITQSGALSKQQKTPFVHTQTHNLKKPVLCAITAVQNSFQTELGVCGLASIG
jgi:hypothetical protein